jgi:hypothetical protein
VCQRSDRKGKRSEEERRGSIRKGVFGKHLEAMEVAKSMANSEGISEEDRSKGRRDGAG